MRVVGILLAAGAGTRFGGDKLLAPFQGDTVGAVACRHLVAAIPNVLAIVRPRDDALAAELQNAGAAVLRCADAERGIGASLAYGVRASRGESGWVVALADMPWIRSETIGLVADAIANGDSLAAPFFCGRRGHPVGFGRMHVEALAALDGDEGARSVLLASSALTRIDVGDPGVLRDVDAPADLVGEN
jgi:molybdenum cofactor cytidylyltransferase